MAGAGLEQAGSCRGGAASVAVGGWSSPGPAPLQVGLQGWGFWKSQGFRSMGDAVNAASPSGAGAKGRNTGLIPQQVQEGKAATSHLDISLHPSGSRLSGVCGPENAACSWEGGSGQSFRMLLWFNSARGGERTVE